MTDNKPTRDEALQAVRTLLRWTGDNPDRDGLKDTPKRVIDAYSDWFSGYDADPVAELSRTFEETEGYDAPVILRNIPFESHCEHHIAPIIGVAHVAYIAKDRVVGLSKLARVVDIFAKRLQTQEFMTVQIANAINDALKPRGVAVIISAEHECMSTRGVHKSGVDTITTHFLGDYSKDANLRRELMDTINGG